MKPELSRMVPLHRITRDGLDVRVDANEAECAALTKRMGLPAILSLSCDYRLRMTRQGAIAAKGELKARVMQTCVVTMDDFEADVTESFRVRFVPAGTESDDLDPDADDDIGYDGEAIDLGEATAQQLSLALDPYPHKPGVTFEPGA
jgi:Large ribosomal RNA subunit accumulation protein YceD